jgi:DNA ligase-1
VYDRKTGRYLPFQVTITRKHGTAAAAARHPLRLYVFDLLSVNGRDYVPRPLRERQERLAEVLRATPRDPLMLTEVFVTGRAGELERYFRAMLRRGLEGIVAKRPDAPYRAGARGYDWVKLRRAYQAKLRDTVDVVIVGYLAGHDKRGPCGSDHCSGRCTIPRTIAFAPSRRSARDHPRPCGKNYAARSIATGRPRRRAASIR